MLLSKLYDNLFHKKDIVPEVLIAYKYKVPDNIDVFIRQSEDGGYVIDIKNLKGCITQAENGKEIFEMVNDALYTYLEIPTHYQPYMPTFFPTENVRKQFNIKIPKEYLEKELSIQRI